MHIGNEGQPLGSLQGFHLLLSSGGVLVRFYIPGEFPVCCTGRVTPSEVTITACLGRSPFWYSGTGEQCRWTLTGEVAGGGCHQLSTSSLRLVTSANSSPKKRRSLALSSAVPPVLISR